MTFDRLLIPTDFSEFAEEVGACGMAVAHQFQASTHLRSVVHELRPQWYERDDGHHDEDDLR